MVAAVPMRPFPETVRPAISSLAHPRMDSRAQSGQGRERLNDFNGGYQVKLFSIETLSGRGWRGYVLNLPRGGKLAYSSCSAGGAERFRMIIVGNRRFYPSLPPLPYKVRRALWTARECFPMFWYANQWCCDTRRTFAWYKTWTWGPASVRSEWKQAEMSTDGPGGLQQIPFYKWIMLPRGGRY